MNDLYLEDDFLQDGLDTFDSALYHHGILGQKWYIRRFQNSDGSLTSEGRKRYSVGDKDKKTNGYKSVEGVKFNKEFGKVYANSPEIRKAGEELYKKNKAVTKQFDELTDLYGKENDRLRNDSAFISKMANKMKTDFGLEKGDIDDPELLLSFADDVVYDNIRKYYSSELKSKEADLQKSFDDYYDSAKAYVDNIVKDKGDTVIDGDQTYRSAVNNTIGSMGESGWIHYLYNHQESTYYDSDVTYSDVAMAVVDDFNRR